MKKTELKKGINLCLICDKKFKEFKAVILLHRPLSREEVTLNSLTTAVMRMQSKNYPDATAVSVALENLYGADLIARASKYGEEQLIKIGVRTISSEAAGNDGNFENALRLLFDIAFNAGNGEGFSEEITKNEKKNIGDAILSQQNDKRTYSVLRLQEEMCKDEPYGINPIGYQKDLEAITQKELYEHYRRILKESRIDIIFTGNFDEAAAQKATQLYTEQLEEREGVCENPVRKNNADKVKTVTDRMDVTQGKLCMGFRSMEKTSIENYASVLVYNTVFGGSATSKLFNNVREKLSLCYYVGSSIDRLKEIMIVRSGVEFENFGKAYDEIMTQQECMVNGDFSDEEIENAKKHLINAYSSSYDSIGSMTEYYTMQLLLGTDISIDKLIENIRRVTKAEIVKAASGMRLDTVYFLKSDKEAE